MKNKKGEFFIGTIFLMSLLATQPLATIGNSVQPTITTPSPTIPLAPQSTQAQQSQTHAQHAKNLGKNKLARFAAWASLACTSAIGVFISYKTLEEIFDYVLEQLPLLRVHHLGTAQAASALLVGPPALVSLLRLGPLGWYFYYMLYAGERLSPLLAQQSLHDLSVYVNHLQTVKSVQAELLTVIDLINQQLENKKEVLSHPIDPVLLQQLEDAINQDEAYIQQIIQQLQMFLSDEEIAEVLQSVQQPLKDIPDFSITTNLQDQAHTIAQSLQASDVDLGYDVVVLNQLIKDLIDYWQLYTTSLAEGIDSSMQFCNNVYWIEQIIITWFDRALFSA